MNNIFYVYCIKENDITIYIGKGSFRRHLQSRRRFIKMGIKVTSLIIEKNMAELVAFEKEKFLIEKHKPLFNKLKGEIGHIMNRDRKIKTLEKTYNELLTFNKRPKKTAPIGTQEYRLARKIDAILTKKKSTYNKEYSEKIKNLYSNWKGDTITKVKLYNHSCYYFDKETNTLVRNI